MLAFLTLILVYYCLYIFLKILFIYFQREGKGEKEGEKHQCVVASHGPPTGDLACNPGTCPAWETNQRPFCFAGQCSVHRATPARAIVYIFNYLSNQQSESGSHLLSFRENFIGQYPHFPIFLLSLPTNAGLASSKQSDMMLKFSFCLYTQFSLQTLLFHLLTSEMSPCLEPDVIFNLIQSF